MTTIDKESVDRSGRQGVAESDVVFDPTNQISSSLAGVFDFGHDRMKAEVGLRAREIKRLHFMINNLSNSR